MKIIYLFFVLSIIYLGRINAQNYHAKILTTENGLPSDKIYHAKEDAKGFIWIGTKNGVVRWDSKNFEYFTLKDGLPNNEVTAIQEDSEGRIWFSTFNKSISYYYNSKIFNPKTDTRLVNIKLGGDIVLRPVDTFLYYYHEDNHIVKKIISKTLEVTNSDLPKGHVDVLKIGNKKLSFSDLTCYKDLAPFFKEYGNKRILKELFKHPNFGLRIPKSFQTEIDSLIKTNLDSIFDPSFRIKDLLSKKQFILSKQKGKLFYQSNSFSLIFDSPNISKKIEDDILKLFFLKNKIHFLTKDKVVFSNSPLTKVRDLSFQNALYNLDREGSRQFMAETSNLYEVSDNFKNRAVEYGLDNIKYVNYHPSSNSIYIGTGKGLFLRVGNKTKILNTKRVYSVKLNSKNILWYSTTDNLYYTHQLDTVITAEKELILNPNFKVFVNEIREDKAGYMIFATNNGIYFYHPETKLKYWLNDVNFLSSNECNRVEIDPKDGSLWVSTFNGLNHIQYSSVDGKLKFKLINRFFKDDGLYANEINDFLIHGDSVWVATPKGLNLIHNKNYRPAAIKVPIHINKLWVNEMLTSLDSGLHFGSDENNLSFDFSAIYYQRRDRLTIQYKLISGKDTSSKIITDNKINLLALRDGEYEFQLYAYDQDYPYIHSEVKSIRFTIKPPFYKAWWFWTLLVTAAGSAIGYLYYNRMLRKKNREIKQAETQSKLNEYSLKSLQNQMNPHFIFNSLNTMQHLMTSHQDEEALDYLSDFSDLMREMLANSRLESIQLSDEINFLNKYIELEKVRFSHEFDLEWKINIEPDLLDEIAIPAMLIQPIVENAIKHGAFVEKNKQGKIKIEVNLLSKTMMQFIISNTKQYVQSPSSRGNDTALKVIRERLDLYQIHNQKGEFKLDVQDHLAVATINIPI